MKYSDSKFGERGFSVVEGLVSIIVFSLLVLVAVMMLQSGNKMTRSALIKGDSQQSARVGMDVLTKDLRSVGYGLDVGGGQRALVHGGPWDLIFNANVRPVEDDPVTPDFPRAIDTNLGPATVPPGGPLYAPGNSFSTGAETIRFTLDSSGDGIIDANDLGDDPEEATPNPRDFVLRKEVYGARNDGTNGGNGEPTAIVRGPLADQNNELPVPLFSYWIDHDNDPTTAEILHGDANADGEFSQTEIQNLTPVAPDDLALVTRIIVTLTSEDAESYGRPDYRSRELISSVAFRNEVRRSAIIAGVVYQDTDGDGIQAADEDPIPSVTVRLSSGATRETDILGRYAFDVAAGSYTVTEFDEPGYISTTDNTVAIDAQVGSTHRVDFGDRPASGIGRIYGAVYEDANANQTWDGTERGIPNVVLTLHTGLADTTAQDGTYAFDVPVGVYTIVETDSTGYASTTPNAVEVLLSADGQQEKVLFGDIRAGLSGTLKGTVFFDVDADGIFDTDEGGIADVPITVSTGDSTITDGNGAYSFTLPAGVYQVREWDLEGYTSSTPNLASGVQIVADSTTVVDFGDLYDTSLNFTVVTVGSTDRALSISSTDLQEDARGDSDIVLGTQISAGSTNLHVWHNQRRNSGTPITALFEPAPSFSRSAGAPIPALGRMDVSGDGVSDYWTGLDETAGINLSLWITETSGGTRGMFPNSPNETFQTMAGYSVLVVDRVTWPGTSGSIVLLGTVSTSGAGGVEVWQDQFGGGQLVHLSTYDIRSDSYGALGEVTSLATGDFNRDGYPDVAIGQRMTGNVGRVTIMAGNPVAYLGWSERSILFTDSAVLALDATDMKEDNAGDLDLLAGTSVGPGAGKILLWHNDGYGGFGTPGPSGPLPSDWVDAGGEVLSLDSVPIDVDVFPEVVVGLRTTQYSGGLNVFRTFGYLPSSGSEWSHQGSGEVVSLTVDDYNIDGLPDIAVGTRTAASTGELVVYFGS